MSLSEFLHMGGYGFYVWWSYGLFAAAIIWMLVLPRIQKGQRLKAVRQQMALEQLRQERAATPRASDPPPSTDPQD